MGLVVVIVVVVVVCAYIYISFYDHFYVYMEPAYIAQFTMCSVSNSCNYFWIIGM